MCATMDVADRAALEWRDNEIKRQDREIDECRAAIELLRDKLALVLPLAKGYGAKRANPWNAELERVS
jgi:hypothetical protein